MLALSDGSPNAGIIGSALAVWPPRLWLISAAALCVGLICPDPATAQARDFSRWLEQRNDSFAGFETARDSIFVDRLNGRWLTLESEPPTENLTDEPKPSNAPAIAGFRPTVSPRSIVESAPSGQLTAPKPLPSAVEAPGSGLSLQFLGLELPLAPVTVELPQAEPVSSSWLASGWSLWATRDDPERPIWQQVTQACAEWKLPDWGCVLLAQEVGTRLMPNSSGKAINVFAWYVLTKAGWGVQVGYTDDQVFLLLPTDEQLFGLPSVLLNDQEFYLHPAPGETAPERAAIRTYENAPAQTPRTLSSALPSLNFGSQIAERRLIWQWAGNEQTVDVRYNASAVDLFSRMPRPEMPMILGTPLSEIAMRDLHTHLDPLLAGASALEQLNLLLTFTQFALPYQVDDAQFGEERYLWPEETLHYQFSDCEDRVFFLAALVIAFLGRDVIALDYPGHVALGVQWPDTSTPGDRFIVDGISYLVADPTYLGASAGMTMPQLSNVAPAVIIPRR